MSSGGTLGKVGDVGFESGSVPGAFGRGRRGQQHFGPPSPVAAREKAKNAVHSLKRLARTLRPERARVGVVLALAVVRSACAVTAPLIMAHAVNLIFEGYASLKAPAGMTKDEVIAGLRLTGQNKLASLLTGVQLHPGQGVYLAALGKVLAVLVGFYIVNSLLNWLQVYLMAGVVQRTVYRLRREIDVKVARVPLSYFDRHTRGDTLSRLANDVDNIEQTLQQTLTQLITAGLVLLGVVGMMFWISPLLAVIAVFALPASAAVAMLIGRRSQHQFAEQWERTGRLNAHVEETVTGHNLVKVFGRQEEVIASFDEQNRGLRLASFKAQFISGMIMPLVMFGANVSYVATCVLGGIRVANGSLSLGAVQAFIQYTFLFSLHVSQTAGVSNVIQSAAASAERVFEMLDEPEEAADPPHPAGLEQVKGHIVLRDVSFRYLPDVPLIEGLDLEVRPGQTVAIVGPTGAGKTTLVNLLMRFYELDHGTITIDGVDARTMTRDGLRRLFGMVLQETWLFDGTIRENIAYGRGDASGEDIRRAAEAAHVHHFARTLPDGYETVLTNGSSNLSQGERQLLTIARAFLSDPQILILDEATSSVDTRTEMLVQKAMTWLLEGRTSFVIAHRLSTIRHADVILVMNRGSIIEQGTHQELLDRRGFYYDLYNSQFLEALEPVS